MENVITEINQIKTSRGEDLNKQTLSVIVQLVSKQHPDAHRLLHDVLDKQNITPYLRAAVVSNLKQFPGYETEMLLLRLLEKESNVVQSHACKVLMQIGSEQVLPLLEKLNTSDSNIRFVHTVLCHKHGIASKFIKPYLDKPQLPIKGDAESFQSTQLSNMTQRELIQALNNDAFKLGVYSNTGLGIRCSGGHSALVFHEQVISNGIKNSLRERPTILGAIARKNQEYKTWSFSRIVLGGPLDKSSFYICVFRRDGQLMFYGVGKHDENMVELSSVDQPGCFAVRANVYWHENKVVIAGISTLKKTQARVAEVYNLSQAKSTIL